jgi:hypothetical protein
MVLLFFFFFFAAPRDGLAPRTKEKEERIASPAMQLGAASEKDPPPPKTGTGPDRKGKTAHRSNRNVFLKKGISYYFLGAMSAFSRQSFFF